MQSIPSNDEDRYDQTQFATLVYAHYQTHIESNLRRVTQLFDGQEEDHNEEEGKIDVQSLIPRFRSSNLDELSVSHFGFGPPKQTWSNLMSTCPQDDDGLVTLDGLQAFLANLPQ